MLSKFYNQLTDEARIQSEGQKDGERNIPEMGSYAPAQFEQALIAHGEQEVQRIYQRASGRVSRFQHRFEDCQKRLRDIEGRLKGVLERYKARKDELGRDLAIRFPYKFHIALLIFLSLGEFPLNTIVFRLFGEPEFLTYIMASTLAITIPLLGLFIGIHLRQSVPVGFGNAIIGILIPVSAGAALFSISMLRNTYIFSQSSLSSPTPSEQDGLAYALFALNGLVFCGAMASSFFSHDPDDKLDSCHTSLIFLDRRLNRLRKQHYRLGSRLNGEIRSAKAKIDRIRSLTSQRVALYRQTNMRYRRLTAPPTFRKNPEFRKLEWWPEAALQSEEGSS